MNISSSKYRFKATFTGPILGSQPGRDTPASDFIRGQVQRRNPEIPIEDEVETLPEALEKGTTAFHKNPADGKPCLYNYHIKGALKAAGDALNGVGGFKQLRSKIDNTVFVSPRIIPIVGVLSPDMLERPLRCMTMQGPRVSLARSEMIEAGATIEAIIECMETPKFELTEDMLRAFLDYSTRLGIGQWRNSGIFGSYEYTLEAL